METITKKEFKMLHSSNKLKLRGSFFKKSKEDIINRLKEYKGTLPEYPISRASIDNQGECYKVNIFTWNDYILVETIFDASLDNCTSCNDITKDVVLYSI